MSGIEARRLALEAKVLAWAADRGLAVGNVHWTHDTMLQRTFFGPEAPEGAPVGQALDEGLGRLRRYADATWPVSVVSEHGAVVVPDEGGGWCVRLAACSRRIEP